MKDDNYKMAASSRLPRGGGGGGNTLQDDPFIDVNEMKTEIFALPGLPFDDTLYNYNIQFDAGDDLDQNRGSRQMCLDGGREENCFSLDPTTSFGNDFGSFNRDMWVMPMLGLAAMNVLVILAYEIFVICKATGNSPSRRYVYVYIHSYFHKSIILVQYILHKMVIQKVMAVRVADLLADLMPRYVPLLLPHSSPTMLSLLIIGSRVYSLVITCTVMEARL